MIQTVKPIYGKNYDEGWIGFTYTNSSFISQGIAWFERWDNRRGLPVSHVLLITGPNSLIESTTPKGVSERDLQGLFDKPDTLFIALKPKGLNHKIAKELVEEAKKYVGYRYDYSLIVGNFITSNFIGKFFNFVTRGYFNKGVLKIFDKSKMKICSEFVATVLKSHPAFKDKGCLKKSLNEITPQMLFEDKELFE